MRTTPKQREALELVADGRIYPDLVEEEDGWYARWRPLGPENGWVDAFVREFCVTPLTEDAEEQRHETLHDAWLAALSSRSGLVRWDASACAEFAAELRAWSGNAEEDVAARRALVFTLETPPTTDGSFALSCPAPHARRVLKALGQAAYVFGPIAGLRRVPRAEAPDRLAVTLTRAEAESFLRTGAKALADAAYGVVGADRAAAVTAQAELFTETQQTDVKSATTVKLTVRVAGEPVTAAEIRFLLDQGSSLVFFRDRWIEVDRDILRQALRALERGVSDAVSPVAFALGLGHVGALEIEALEAHGWVRGLVHELTAREGAPGKVLEVGAMSAIPGLEATLRGYQRRGVAWLRFLTDHGFGALLADDMGLGKTLQTIAWILSARTAKDASRRPRHVLVVAPLTLLSNWKHECARFAPSLVVNVHQGANRVHAIGFAREAKAADITLTSYNLLVRDYAAISSFAWDALVLDEAQAVKNPDAQAARAAKALAPRLRIALTGTPVENSVADVWSIEDILNPGFLGDRDDFFARFVRPIAADEHSAAAKRLRHALEPFVLRRLKSDPEIGAELGAKREIKEYCVLGDEQRRDYESALARFRAGERRAGDIFALLTELKLVCDGAGKLDRLFELLEGIFAAGESALVFTQYAKVGAWLKTALAQRFKRTFPFLHGGLDAAAREREIAAFNRAGSNAFILSLRAGGFGLNLVKATHVIHFDRWWNPAVERQATDRAHRIGQNRTVFVHVFITAGTLEEHIDEILERKSFLAGSLVGDGESYVRQLAPEAFDRVVSLDAGEKGT